MGHFLPSGDDPLPNAGQAIKACTIAFRLPVYILLTYFQPTVWQDCQVLS
jgi:hypothetical protein